MYKKRTLRNFALIILTWLTGMVLSQDVMAQELQRPMYPSNSYNAEIPSPADFLGYELGDDLTEHHLMVNYIHKLQELAPERVKVEKIGDSQERRPMYLVIISSPENMENLEQHRLKVASLKDPVNTSRAEAEQIASSTPAISWMNYANDGEESAAFEAALQVAYH